MLGGLALRVLGVVAWFFATGRAVTVVARPGDADVDLRGGFSLHAGRHHFARPGRYEVEIEREGYVTLRAPLAIADAANQRFEFQLQKLPGRVEVRTPVAARVTVDGKDLGPAPGEIELPAGRHEVVVVAPRHLPYSAPVDVLGEGKRQLFTAKLVPAWAPVTRTTQPAGATVSVDGRESGAAPVTLELDAGTHRLELRQCPNISS